MGDLNLLTVVQLKELLKEKGLPTYGRKAELIERLTEGSNSENSDVKENEMNIEEDKKIPAHPSQQLNDKQFANYELIAFSIVGLGLALPGIGYLLGHFADYWQIWDLVDVNFIQPIIGEGGGDSSYNPVDTIAYSILLVAFIVSISACLRSLGVPSEDRMLYSLLPWVCWAVLVEVIEDAGLFSAGIDSLFVSPLIHFQTAGWIILIGLMSPYISKMGIDIDRAWLMPLFSSSVIVIAHLLLFYEFSMWENIVAIIFIPIICWYIYEIEIIQFNKIFKNWGHLERGLFSAGLAACMVALISLFQFGGLQYDEGELVLWPLIILFIPVLLLMMFYHRGKEAYSIILDQGRIPGVLLDGESLADWEAREGEEHEAFEQLVRRSSFANPLVLIAVYGQLVDGLASWLGVDFFGYSEKHVLSEYVMRLAGGTAGGTGGGWGFLAVKLCLSIVVVLFFAEWRFEKRQLHLRLLIVLGLLTVGLAPGLRDLGRLILAV